MIGGILANGLGPWRLAPNRWGKIAHSPAKDLFGNYKPTHFGHQAAYADSRNCQSFVGFRGHLSFAGAGVLQLRLNYN